jgi:hypothetical protein
MPPPVRSSRRTACAFAICPSRRPNQLSAAGVEALRAQLVSGGALDPDRPDAVIGAISAELGVPFIPSKPALQDGDYKRFERFHWNERGHRKAAALLKAAYAAHRSGVLVSRHLHHTGAPT